MKRQTSLFVLAISLASCALFGGNRGSYESTFACGVAEKPDTRSLAYPEVLFTHEMLEFSSKDDFDRLVDILSRSADLGDDVDLERFEQRFAPFHSMRARVELQEEIGSDTLADRYPDDVLNTLLNDRGEVKIGRSIWRVYDTDRAVEVLNGDYEALQVLADGTAEPADVGRFKYYASGPLQKKVDPKHTVPKQIDPNDPTQVADDCEAKFKYKIEAYDQSTKKYRVRLINKSTVDEPPMLLAWSVLSELQEAPLVQSTTLNPIVYLSAGEYDVLLQTFDLSSTDEERDGGDCDDTAETILLGECEAKFSYTQGSDCSYTFTSDSAGDSLTYKWTIKDATSKVVANATTETFSHKFSTKGAHTVSLDITSASGCTATTSQVVNVENTCKPNFEPCYVCGERNVLFKNLSSCFIEPVKWAWDFGDGTKSSDYSPTHTYAGSKTTYTVTLTMEDSSGCKDSYPQDIELLGCDKAEFDYRICPDGRVTFDAKNAHVHDKLEWTFSGAKVPWVVAQTIKNHPILPIQSDPTSAANSEIVKHPWVYYKFPGTYGVQLKITSVAILDKALGKNPGCVTFLGTKRIDITSVQCCNRPNESVRKSESFYEGGKEYKMKAVLSQTNLPFYHRVGAKTKIRQKKNLLWKHYNKVAQIQATVAGKAYEDEGDWIASHVTHKRCCCFSERAVSADSGSVTGHWKAHTHADLGGAFRTRVGSITSSHTVKISDTATSKTLTLSLGSVCAYR